MERKKMIIGIDPGLNGAVSILDRGEFSTASLPLSSASSIDTALFYDLMHDLIATYDFKKPPIILIEGCFAGAMAGNTVITMGKNIGRLLAVFELLDLQYFTILPNIWQKKIAPNAKPGGMKKAVEEEMMAIYGGVATFKSEYKITKAKWEGIIDALAIAHYALINEEKYDDLLMPAEPVEKEKISAEKEKQRKRAHLKLIPGGLK